MNDELDQVLAAAMKLTPESRAALVGSLLESLDKETDEHVEAAWVAEILRRLEEYRSGRARPIDWDTARRAIRGG